MRPVTVALRNDYEVVVRGLEMMLEPFADRVQVVELDVNIPPGRTVDVTLFDTFSQGQVDGEPIDQILQDPKAGKVVVYTWNQQSELVQLAREKGLAGYVDKSATSEELVRVLERVAAGERVFPEQVVEESPLDMAVPGAYPGQAAGLSGREAEVVALITQGLTNEEIARRAYLSINTIKTYIRSAYQKMGVTRRSEAVRWGMEHGMLPDAYRRVVPARD